MTTHLSPQSLILLPGDLSILVFTDINVELPDQAMVEIGSQACSWMKIGWVDDGKNHAISIVGAAPSTGFEVMGTAGEFVQIGPALTLTPDIKGLADAVLRHNGPVADVCQLLHATIEDLASSDMTDVLLRFLELAVDHSGFVELAASPETGGLFLQGWSTQEMAAKYTLLTDTGEVSAACGGFARDDLIAPATGFCLYARNHPAEFNRPKCVYLLRQNDLRRLDVLPDLADPFCGEDASEHVRTMLPRLVADDAVIDQFKRVCRPRFVGEDSLSAFDGPVAVGLDLVLRAEGGLFVTGWILDPLAQIDLTLIKSTRNLYAPLWPDAHSLQRPDLHDAFGQEPRFAGILDPSETKNGFLCFLPAAPEQLDGAEIYLELVLHNGQCLFQPIVPKYCRDLGAAHAVLNTVPRQDPALDRVLTRHVAPFLAGLSPKTSDSRHQMIPMGEETFKRKKEVAALMPVSNPDDLKPIFATLSDTQEASDLELIVIVEDTMDPKTVSDLNDQFSFYGLSGGAISCASRMSQAERLDIAVQATQAPYLLLWCPQAIPQTKGWLDLMRAEVTSLPTSGLVSPLLSYEDGSIHFGGKRIEGRPSEAISQLAGFNRTTKETLQNVEVSAGAPEMVLIEREVLESVGGIAGSLLGDKYTHHGLGVRLRQANAAAWCAPQVEFWMLPDRSREAKHAQSAFIDSVDSALILHLADTQSLQKERSTV
ncbi:MAG: hypothetical protein ABJQ70_16320 [Roseobacter sp.]